MKILFLGGETQPEIYGFLRGHGEKVTYTSKKLTLDKINQIDPEFIISYNYKYIIKRDVLEAYKDRVINLHISLLPWNRGAHPNFWSFWENSPKGVTIHYVDEGIDTGDIIIQKELEFNQEHLQLTLQETYDILQREIQNLFVKNWESIRLANNPRKEQKKFGSFHYVKDIEAIWSEINEIGGWNCRIYSLQGLKQKYDSENSG